jgi:streptogramin lyase
MGFHVFPCGIAGVFGLGASLLLAGCGAGGAVPGTASGSSAGTPAALTGIVHSGQQPISGASVNLYIAGASGYGTGAVSLLSGSVVTGKDGKFNIPGGFTCPSADAQAYVIAKAGDAGAGDNPNSVLMAALGNCGDLGSDVVLDVSEVSSVASVYALAQFMTPGSTAVGTSSTNVRGLVNAFATVENLIDSSTGLARKTTTAGNGTVPQTTINALANIMAACVATKGDGACPQLFSLATPPGGTAPGDTLSAILDIALNPGNNVAKLAALQPSTLIFQPALAGTPSDWTLSIEYSGGGLNLPQLLAVDGSGNIWVPNAVDPGTLSEFSPTGDPLSGKDGFSGGGLSYPEAVAADISGNIWSANEGLLHGVSEHSSNGTPLSGSAGYTAVGLVQPVAIALDAAGDVFTANLGGTSVTKLNSAGRSLALFANGGLDEPYAVAVDTSQNVWVANSGPSNSVSRFNNTGTPANGSGYHGSLSQPYGIAIDANGNAWVANFSRASVSKLSNAGAVLSGAGYSTPASVSAVAVDGNNTVWTANTDGSISHLSASGASISPPGTGYVSAAATAEVGIALDASGNVWTTDNYINSIFEYIGAAAPTVTPLQLAVKNKTMGQRP